MADNPYQSLFDKQQAHFFSHLKNGSCEQRREQLRLMLKWVLSHQDEICAALAADRGKSKMASLSTEVFPVVSEIKLVRRHLADWMRPQRVPTPITLLGGRSWVETEPKGVCLVIAPWNFPFMLVLLPLVSAIAAGNAVVVKPSEEAPHTAALVQKMVDHLFDPEEVSVVTGGVPETTQLLALPWNHILFTGSTQVGKIVMRAAAEHLSGVTLELGGANPAIVDETADLKDAAMKIAWGRYFNDGASCVSPNHVFVHQSVHDKFAQELRNAVRHQFGPDYAKSGSLGRMVHERHWQRTEQWLQAALAEGAQVLEGGVRDIATLKFSPTLLTSVSRDSVLVREETFGPLLPLLPYTDLSELIAWHQSKDIPLAFYHFSRHSGKRNEVVRGTRSGTMGLNVTTLQFPQMELPFGGQNASGSGKSHGYQGFLAFSNMRSFYRDPRRFFMMRLLYPPYKGWKERLIRLINNWL
jgi:aldehyde dehydrogenase (NAD+)